jgi:iron-sulfur cluster assembly accessory protein
MPSVQSDLPSQDPGLQMTSGAIAHLKKSLEKSSEQNAIGIRIGVRKAGCSGYEYHLEFAYPDSQQEHDFVFAFDNMAVLVDKEIYLKFLKGGTVVDFRHEGINAGLHFENPNVGAECGCGESFTLSEN